MLIDIIKEKNVDTLLQEKAIRALWALCISNRKHISLHHRVIHISTKQYTNSC